MGQEVNYITPRGYQRLSQERDHLVKEERPEVCKLIAWAASNGDRSENADYLYGKKRLREIDRRLRFLNKRLELAQVIDPLTIDSKKIQFGATVELIDENEEAKTYTIVGVDEVETKQGHISWKSPLGKAMIGKTIGDSFTLLAPGGEREFEVSAIEYLAMN